MFTTLYFVGGAVTLKLLRGAEGREMIPNYDFWVDLPNLVSVSVCCLCSYGHICHCFMVSSKLHRSDTSFMIVN